MSVREPWWPKSTIRTPVHPRARKQRGISVAYADAAEIALRKEGGQPAELDGLVLRPRLGARDRSVRIMRLSVSATRRLVAALALDTHAPGVCTPRSSCSSLASVNRPRIFAPAGHRRGEPQLVEA